MMEYYLLIKRYKHGRAGEETLRVRALAAHAEDLGLVVWFLAPPPRATL